MKNTVHLSNFHTHSTFCDGKNTPEEIVLTAIQKGFSAIGFSGHGYTPFDLRYCTKDMEGYIREVERVKDKYAGQIEIYLGAEEDAFCPVDRSRFSYLIGSSHYYLVEGKYLPIDSGLDYFKACLDAFANDTRKMADTYYRQFCDYILRRKPDIIGHFDLITKFDECHTPYFLDDPQYEAIAETYLLKAMQSGSIFEVNTGAISRGYRKTVYPGEQLLYLLKREDAKLILSSDSHAAETIDFYFAEARRYLYDIGFRHVYTLSGGKFIPVPLL